MVPANPATKAVPRTALYTPTPPSTSPEPELEEQLHAHLARIYPPSSPPITTTTDAPPAETPSDPFPPDEAQTYEFRLFSTPTTHSTNPPTQKVVIRSPTPPLKDGVGEFVVPHRARRYYFFDDGAATGRKRKRRREFEEVGISGEDVLRLSRVKWPGCALPWRVVTLRLSPHNRRSLPSSTSSSSALAPQSLLTPGPGLHVRKRPNKKRRLALHKALAASKAFAAAREMSAREREVGEREKRTRRNREKKVKRKMKGKEAKKKVEGVEWAEERRE